MAATLLGDEGIDLSQLPPGLQIQVPDEEALKDPRTLQIIREAIERVRANPLLRYVPHAKQIAFHANPRKTRVFLGGERSGKSVAGLLDDLIQAVDESVVPDHLLPYKIYYCKAKPRQFTCRIVTPDYGAGFQELLKTLGEWCPQTQLLGGEWKTAYSDKAHKLILKNGNFFDFKTTEQDPSTFGGVSRTRLHYDEEPKGPRGKEIWHANVTRTAQQDGDEIFTFSPVNDFGWTFDGLWEKRGEEVAKEVWLNDKMVLVRASQEDNPHIDHAGMRASMEKLEDDGRMEARLYGKFVHSKGMVYAAYDRELHTVEQMDPEFVAGLDHMDCIDPGLKTSILLAGFDRDNCLYIYDELFLEGDDVIPENAAELLRAKRKDWGLKPKAKLTLIDPAAAAKNHQTNKRTDSAYRNAGVSVRGAQNDVQLGIFECRRRLSHKDGKGNPQPLVQIGRNCKRLLYEIPRYRQETGADEKLEVVKEDDHAVDNFKYLSLQRPLPRLKKPSRRGRPAFIPGQAPPAEIRPRVAMGPYGPGS